MKSKSSQPEFIYKLRKIHLTILDKSFYQQVYHVIFNFILEGSEVFISYNFKEEDLMTLKKVMNIYIAPKLREHSSIIIVLNRYMSIVWGKLDTCYPMILEHAKRVKYQASEKLFLIYRCTTYNIQTEFYVFLKLHIYILLNK